MIPKIENAFENIKAACESRLKELYPLGAPTIAIDRYEKELSLLLDFDFVDDFEIFRCLYAEARRSSLFMMHRGDTESSYIAYLLSNTLVNPLPAHYYCPNCGYSEVIETKLFGIDLPDCECPHCHKTMDADGFNLHAERLFHSDHRFGFCHEYNVSEELLPFAKRVLEALYPNNNIVPRGFYQRPSEGEESIKLSYGGFFILPNERTVEDYPDLQGYLEDGEICLTSNPVQSLQNHLKNIVLLNTGMTDALQELQRKTGFYVADITIKDLRTITCSNLLNTLPADAGKKYLMQVYKPKTFYDFACLDGACHNSYYFGFSEYGVDSKKLIPLLDSDEFKAHPCYTDDDFYDELIKLGYNNEKAIEISRFIQKGKHAINKQKFIDTFNAYNLPDSLKTVANMYRYIFPKAHIISYVILNAMIAYYANKNRKIFSKVMYNHF